MPIDIQINEDPHPKASNLVEEKPNENQKEVNEIGKNDKSKIDETNFPIGENNKGLFNQLQEDEMTNNNIEQDNKKDDKNLEASKIDDTNLNMPVNNGGLFNQKIELENNDTIESNKMTLDEPVLDSLKRDLFRIYNKLKHVITPRLTSRKIEELYNWDLWGPLIFCFLLCISLSNDNNESSTFVVIFTIYWIGGLVVTFNGQFLGANIGICQMICLLGYCSFPITLGGMIIGFFNITKGWMKCVIVFVAFLWSCLASVGFVSALVPREKELITNIPVVLFFVALSLFVLNY